MPTIHPPLVNAPMKLTVDNEEISLIQFIYDIILNQNLELFILLKRIPTKEEIQSFQLTIRPQYNPDGNIITAISKSSMDPIALVTLFINEKRVGLKQFVQNIIFGINFGIIQTLEGYTGKIEEIQLTYKK
ncbi:MAG: hypothetical protein JW776_11180 [Candidatus Lokiarchaeota archaeon]|nr:hypothetical protein [Candidatus Lokiarchaeota archaeon]